MRFGCRAACLAALASTVALTGCGGGSSSASGGSSKTVTVAYQDYGTFVQADQLMKQVKAQFEKAHPGTTIKLEPIKASENDYYTKLDLMARSASTAPDVMYEDTFLINSDIAAGYLQPLDKYLSTWPDWSQFFSSAKDAAKGVDGKTYGIPMGTDTRALWYNKQIFAKAGLPVPWKPKTWADVLDAARTIKAKVPGVIPLNVYSGKAAGEAATMQGFEMLLYGTDNTLYNKGTGKWISPSPGFDSSLGFIKTVYQSGLGPTPQQALDPNVASAVSGQWLPDGKLAIDLDGSWIPSTWIQGGTRVWPQWSQVMGAAPMPTENGQAPGSTSMSGGWTLAVGSKSKNPQLAFQFISQALNEKNSLFYDIAAQQIPVRKDVAAEPSYAASNPEAKFFADLVKVTHFRPALPPYPQISNQIQVAMESVMTGQSSPKDAMSAYTSSLKGIVGPDKVTAAR